MTTDHPWVLAYQQGSTIQEIAEEAGEAPSTVRMLLAAAGVTSKRPRNPGPGRPPKAKTS